MAITTAALPSNGVKPGNDVEAALNPTLLAAID